METSSLNTQIADPVTGRQKFGIHSLAFRFAVSVLIGVLAIEAAVFMMERYKMQSHLESVALKEAGTVTESLQYAMEGLAETGDRGAISRMVQNQSFFEHVKSLSVASPSNEIIADGDMRQIGASIEDLPKDIQAMVNSARIANLSQDSHRLINGKRELVYVMPLNGTLFGEERRQQGHYRRGVAILILDLNWIDEELKSLLYGHLQAVIPGLALITLIIVFCQHRLVIKPLNQLIHVVDHHEAGMMSQKSASKRDEISVISNRVSDLFLELELANHRFELAVTGSNDGLFDFHIETDHCWYSKHFSSLLGLGDKELASNSQSWLERIHPDHLATVQDTLAKHIENKQAFTLEYPVRKENGDYAWVNVKGSPTCDENENVTHVSGSVRDITSRKLIEDEMSIQRLELQAILDAIPAYIFYKNGDNQILHMNQAAADLIGLPRESLEGLYMHELLSPKEAKHEHKQDLKVLKSGKPTLDVVEPFDTPAGNRVWIRTDRLPLDINDDHSRLVVVSTDITHQRATERRLNMAINGAKMGLWDWDLISGKVYYNDTWFTMLGYDANEFPNHYDTFKALCHPDDLPEVEKQLESHLKKHNTQYRMNIRMKHKSGHWHWVHTVGEASDRDSMGRPKRMSGVHFDIDEQKQLEEKLRSAQHAAQQANTAKSEFLANMSHELRTPLTAILGFTDILRNDAVDNDTKDEALGTIERNGEHLLTLINDILDMSKIEAGKMTTESIAVNPGELLREVTDTFNRKAEEKGLSLKFECNSDLPTFIKSDPVRLRQIIFNLISNALKFTHAGSIAIKAQLIEVDKAPILQVQVEDTGIGMSETQINRLFEAFSQADNSTTRKYGGTGLGLRISRSLAQMLGGDLSVSSKISQGSTFTLTVSAESINASLPDQAPMQVPQAQKPENQTSPASPLDGRHILLAEDGPDNQRLISFVLKKAGAAVTIVENGQLALNAASDEKANFDLILMDMQMPELDGYQATRQIRERGLKIPVIALTANALTGDREKCLNAGCDDYASKPINKDALIETCMKYAA